MMCRHCGVQVSLLLIDLGSAPPSNAYLTRQSIHAPELWFPLRVMVCERCWLVQTEDFTQAAALFNPDYAYFSSTSKDWLTHAAQYSQKIIDYLELTADSFVIEVASNDGYLLKNFVPAGIPCLGIEPTASTAAVAESLGIPVLREFFGEALGQKLAAQGKQADLIVGNNVYAHVPDINDFTRGLKVALKAEGTITLEFPHVLQMLEKCLFDTIYHEHFSYLSLGVVQRIFAAAGLQIFNVEKLSTHGGSLRVFGCHAESGRIPSQAVINLLEEEKRQGLEDPHIYTAFQQRAEHIKNELLAFLLEQKRLGNLVVAYGAAAKGNTLLNYAGIRPDLLPFVCDAAPSKQGKYLPGSRIPIVEESWIKKEKPDFVLVLPWNIKDEISNQLSYIQVWGGRLLTAVPNLKVET